MSDGPQEFDVIVVGGGVAGLVAARDLTDQGRRVVLLEARDRLGGRTWTTTFPGTDRPVDMGGQWLYPDGQPGLVNELARYGVETDHSPMPGSFPTVLAGSYNPGPLPVPFEQFPDLERAILRCQLAASRITPGAPLDHQGLGDLDIPFDEFLAPLTLPAETYAFVVAVAAVYLCRYPEEMSALAVLHALALVDLSAFAMWGVIDVRFTHGASSLTGRIAADLPDVRLSTPVTAVRQDDHGVTVTTAAGAELRASAAVVATPMNLWNDIAFDPPLSPAKRESCAERHGVERSGKAWLRVRGAPPNPFVIADPASNSGALMISTEHTFDDGDQLMPMFGLCSLPGDDYELDCADPASAEKALQALLPGAQLVDHHAHDFNADPWSKGDWASYRPGRLSRSHSVLSAPEGRLTFATSDVAPKWIMWIEGAVECGYQAARQASRILAG